MIAFHCIKRNYVKKVKLFYCIQILMILTSQTRLVCNPSCTEWNSIPSTGIQFNRMKLIYTEWNVIPNVMHLHRMELNEFGIQFYSIELISIQFDRMEWNATPSTGIKSFH